MNTPMNMDDPARLELIARTRPDMLLPHHREMLQKFAKQVNTIAFPQEDDFSAADRRAA